VQADRLWLQQWNQNNLVTMIQKLEAELEQAKNKRVKQGSKKQKEKIARLNYKLTQARKQRERVDEVLSNLDLIDGGKIGTFKRLLKNYMDDPDNDQFRLELETVRLVQLKGW